MIPTKIKPMFNHILVTMERETEDKKIGSLIDVTKREGTVKDLQTVVAVGNTVTTLKPGDIVHINPNRYIKTKHSLSDELQSGTKMDVKVEFPVVELGGVDYLFLFDSDIDYIVEKWDYETDSGIYKEPTIIS